MTVEGEASIQAARARFPAGLIQPAESFRFGQEALLLAAFGARAAAAKNPYNRSWLVIEAGTGAGGALFGFALLTRGFRMIGFDRDVDLIAAARENARLLGLDLQIDFIAEDVETDLSKSGLGQWRGKCNLFLANPPWRKTGDGRKSAHAMREGACRAPARNLENFCVCARELLTMRGFLCLIAKSVMLSQLTLLLNDLSLGIRSILPICDFANEPAGRILLLCQKGAKSEPALEFPLILRAASAPGKQAPLTAAAVNFCPWLR